MKLYKHQEEAVEFLIDNKWSALFHEIGCGKTLTVLTAFHLLRVPYYNNIKLFVVCPISLIEAAWGEDIKKFTKFKYWNLHKSFPSDKDIYDYDIFIVNYECLLTPKFEKNFINRLNTGQWMCALDESSKIKNHKSKITKKLLSMKCHFSHKIIMSGTPAPNCETEYWPQISFLKDRIFHPNFFAFRNHYFSLQRGSQIMNGQVVSKAFMREAFKQGWKYELTDKSRTELLGKINPLCHYAKKKDCLDLPDQIDEIRCIEMGKDQSRVYKQMKINAITWIKENSIESPVIASVALAKLMKLREITSGFAIDDKDNIQETKENPKLKELESVLEEIGDQQVIIWCQFKWEIEKLLSILGEDAKALYSGTKQRFRDGYIQDFKDGKFKYLIAHPASAGHGLTFVNCSIQIFFSMDYSFERYEQARGRTHRAGQVNKCVYIHLMCKDSIDYDVMDILHKKKSKVQIAEEFLK